MTNEAMQRAENATVYTETGGHGVLVPGGFVLTAAHCIDWDGRGGMALGDYYLEKIRTSDGKKLTLSLLAVEPVSDIAVLGSPDNQAFPEESMAFGVFLDACPPVHVDTKEYAFDESVPVAVLNRDGKWIGGKATHCEAFRQAERLWVKAEEDVQGGASGGPIINEKGELVAIVSNFGGHGLPKLDGEGNISVSGFEGYAPRPRLTIPVWVWGAILRA